MHMLRMLRMLGRSSERTRGCMAVICCDRNSDSRYWPRDYKLEGSGIWCSARQDSLSHISHSQGPIESQSCQCRCMPQHTPDPLFELYKNPSVSPRFVPKSERSQIPFITTSLHLPHILSQPIIINNHHANL